MPADLQTIVQRMIDAGEPEEAIASVIQEYPQAQQPESGTAATPIAAMGIGAMKAVPAIVGGISTAAGAVKTAAQSRMGRMTPGVIALDAGVKAMHGDYQGAAKSAATSAVVSQIPRAAAAVQSATNPTVAAVRGAAGRFMRGSKAAGPLMRGASWLSRIADMSSLPLMLASSLSDSLQHGEAQAAKLDDPNLSDVEKEIILRQLHSAGGF